MREGTSIQTRVLNALSTSYARPDERTPADLILFAKKYAACLRYYNSSNMPDGDWEPLMKMDISVTLAALMTVDTRKCAGYKKLLYRNIKLADTEDKAKEQFTYVFDLLFSLVKITDEQYRLLPPSLEYNAVFKNIFSARILLPVVNIKKLFDEFITENMIDTGLELDSSAPVAVSPAVQFNPGALSPDWSPLPVAAVSVPVPALPSVKEKIVYIINHNVFNAQVDSLLNSLSTIVSRAASLFEETLNNFPTHSPHYALYLAFIKLFRHAQDELNNYTQRHLDFYYKDVLQLRNKKPEPDTAHLVFELQKTVDQHLLKKDSLFKGGKDSTGKEINYALTEDVVLNKAIVSTIQALQVLKGTKEIVYASPIAATGDGQGAKLNSTDKSWFTFGNPENPVMADAGFAIASNILYMNEGTRSVIVTVNFANNIAGLAEFSPEPHTGFFTGKLTGMKGWHPINALTVLGNTTGSQLQFTFTLNPDDPAIVPYTEKIHKENFETTLPLLKIYLNQAHANTYPYRLLAGEKIKSVNIQVIVNGVKDLMLNSDAGTVDASKPFKPFGDFPGDNTSFYIGSKEILQKKLTQVQFVFGNSIPYNKEVEYLNDGSWNVISTPADSSNTLILGSSPLFPAAIDFSKNEPLSNTTLEGFLRLRLDSVNFSKQFYLDQVTTQINQTTIQRTADETVTYKINMGTINAPPELMLNSFSVNYRAATNIFLDQVSPDANSRFYHLTPFGYYETYFKMDQPSRSIPLLPEMSNDGELLVGLANAAAETVVNILFHVADGSSNPLKKMETVDWYFLADNSWTAFESYQVIDRTNNFTQSGIVTFTLPSAISDQSTALQKGLHWIKAAVKQNPDAVCKMILVQAQAATVQLMQDDSKQIEFRQQIPFNTISKLVTSDAAIKTITQPAGSSGGRTRESDEHFYIRVSERLRHKQRAVPIWDYEHIILEQFTGIHKVRCINHAGFYTGTAANGQQEEVFCENYPGHVSIITIPDFRGRSGINPLRPYTPAGLRKNIDNYLRTICSPFVKLHVENPQFEEVQFDFKVKFHEGFDESFYTILLDEEIEKFLTPWAYDTSREIQFGNTIIKSVVLNFIEERPYVDYVRCFKMNHIIKRTAAGTQQQQDVEVAAATTARSLLVSYFDEAAKKRHIINSPEPCAC